MSTALNPTQALAFLRLLSCDLGRAVVVSADGRYVVGDRDLGLEIPQIAGSPKSLLTSKTSTGWLLVGTSQALQIGIETGKRALPGLLAHDLRTVLAAMA
jgi:hypothetical protein